MGFTDTQPSILPGIFLVMQCAFKILMIPKSCNSYYISHFAAFFIVVGAKKSIAESCITLVMMRLGEQIEQQTEAAAKSVPHLASFGFLVCIVSKFSSGGGGVSALATSYIFEVYHGNLHIQRTTFVYKNNSFVMS